MTARPGHTRRLQPQLRAASYVPVAHRARPVTGDKLRVTASYGSWRRIENTASGEAVLKGMYRSDKSIVVKAVSRKIDLDGIDLTGLSLEKAALGGGKMSRAKLDRADLTGANLFFSVLEGASLERIEARQANFQGAYLKNASMAHADLRNATFEGACIEGTDFRGADLTGAVFSLKADFSKARFEGAKGLDQVLILDEDHEPVDGARLTEIGLELPNAIAMRHPDIAGNRITRWLRNGRLTTARNLDRLKDRVLGRDKKPNKDVPTPRIKPDRKSKKHRKGPPRP